MQNSEPSVKTPDKHEHQRQNTPNNVNCRRPRQSVLLDQYEQNHTQGEAYSHTYKHDGTGSPNVFPESLAPQSKFCSWRSLVRSPAQR